MPEDPFSEGGGFLDFLEERPEIPFASHLQDQGFGDNKRRQLRSMQSDIYSQFLGSIGSDIRQGKTPSRRYNTFLGDFDFDKYHRGLSPSRRGSFSAPGVRHLTRF